MSAIRPRARALGHSYDAPTALAGAKWVCLTLSHLGFFRRSCLKARRGDENENVTPRVSDCCTPTRTARAVLAAGPIIKGMDMRWLLVLASLLSNTAIAQPSLERILLPIYAPGPASGGYSSVWETELVVVNRGDQPIDVFQVKCAQTCTCPFQIVCVPGKPLMPLEEMASLLIEKGGRPLFLFAERDKLQDLAMNLRVFERSRLHDTFGVEIPVVREADFLVSTAWLVNVPASANSRVRLRVYGVASPTGQGDVRIRVFATSGSVQPALDITRALEPPSLEGRIPASTDFDTHEPGYLDLALPLDALVEQEGRAIIRVDSLTAGLQFWAMASVTNNETQAVTLITPQ
jgi:hypothetical protein